MQMSFIELKSIESAFNGDEKSFEKMKRRISKSMYDVEVSVTILQKRRRRRRKTNVRGEEEEDNEKG